jgi:hypothetical protein
MWSVIDEALGTRDVIVYCSARISSRSGTGTAQSARSTNPAGLRGEIAKEALLA